MMKGALIVSEVGIPLACRKRTARWLDRLLGDAQISMRIARSAPCSWSSTANLQGIEQAAASPTGHISRWAAAGWLRANRTIAVPRSGSSQGPLQQLPASSSPPRRGCSRTGASDSPNALFNLEAGVFRWWRRSRVTVPFLSQGSRASCWALLNDAKMASLDDRECCAASAGDEPLARPLALGRNCSYMIRL